MSRRIDVERVLLQELMEDSPDYIFIKDRQSRFVITNKAHAQLLLGLEDPGSAVGKTDFDLFPDKRADARRFYDEEQSVMGSGQPVIGREWMVPSTTTGEVVWLSESKLPIRDESGEVVGLFGLGRDITALKREQALLERATGEIQELNHHLKDLADRDGLTGIYNRRFFNEYFELEVLRARNFLEHPSQCNDMNFGLAMFDIDRFKHINDTYGHLAGDSVLKQVIAIVKKSMFSRDVFCRYGGDEFVLLLTKTSDTGILTATEKIRREIAEHPFVLGEEHEVAHVTISMGLVTLAEVSHGESEAIVRLADDRLLRAKREGRNRIVYDDDA